jgi:hypothetical protein
VRRSVGIAALIVAWLFVNGACAEPCCGSLRFRNVVSHQKEAKCNIAISFGQPQAPLLLLV